MNGKKYKIWQVILFTSHFVSWFCGIAIQTWTIQLRKLPGYKYRPLYCIFLIFGPPVPYKDVCPHFWNAMTSREVWLNRSHITWGKSRSVPQISIHSLVWGLYELSAVSVNVSNRRIVSILGRARLIGKRQIFRIYYQLPCSVNWWHHINFENTNPFEWINNLSFVERLPFPLSMSLNNWRQIHSSTVEGFWSRLKRTWLLLKFKIVSWSYLGSKFPLHKYSLIWDFGKSPRIFYGQV